MTVHVRVVDPALDPMWKCADCPGPHVWDHSSHCTICGELVLGTTICARCNVPGQQNVKIQEVAHIIDMWEGSPIGGNDD